MKTKVILLAMAVGFLASLAQAADENKKQATIQAKTAADSKKESKALADCSCSTPKKRYVTGSLIPEKIHKRGFITDGMNNVQIVDQRRIRATGASTVKEILARTGVH